MVFSILLLLQVQPIPAPDKPAQDKVVCRTQSVTGSLIASKKVCLTAAQWKERDRDMQEMVDKIQQTSAGPSQ